MARALLWFRNDLRLDDNPALNAAVQEFSEIVPVYVLEDRLLEYDRWGIRRSSPSKLKFLLESLQDLQADLRKAGSELLFRRGNAVEELSKLAEEYDCSTIFAGKEYAYEEVQAERELENRFDTRWFHSSPLIHPEDVPFGIEKLPEVFTQFRKRVEKYGEIRMPLSPPDVIPSPGLPETGLPGLQALGFEEPPPDERAAISFKGGTKAAYERLDHYFWKTDAVAEYKETRNGLIGPDYSTKFSPWLANGSLSPRVVYHELEHYEAEVTKNKSTYWVKFELLWRDFFKYVTMRYGRKIFFSGGIQDKHQKWRSDIHAFERWTAGRTGDDFVDANMRELLYTGFMSNRGRQNVASYLVHQLKQDWRKGAAWFESLLVDYDVSSNYGNWMYAAGVGNDPRDRVFNTKKQAEQYDSAGKYRALWLDEGEDAPVRFKSQYLEV